MTGDQKMDLGEFLGRVLIWGVAGSFAGLRGSNLARCAFLGPMFEQISGFKPEEILRDMVREHLKRERQKDVIKYVRIGVPQVRIFQCGTTGRALVTTRTFPSRARRAFDIPARDREGQ